MSKFLFSFFTDQTLEMLMENQLNCKQLCFKRESSKMKIKYNKITFTLRLQIFDNFCGNFRVQKINYNYRDKSEFKENVSRESSAISTFLFGRCFHLVKTIASVSLDQMKFRCRVAFKRTRERLSYASAISTMRYKYNIEGDV